MPALGAFRKALRRTDHPICVRPKYPNIDEAGRAQCPVDRRRAISRLLRAGSHRRRQTSPPGWLSKFTNLWCMCVRPELQSRRSARAGPMATPPNSRWHSVGTFVGRWRSLPAESGRWRTYWLGSLSEHLPSSGVAERTNSC